MDNSAAADFTHARACKLICAKLLTLHRDSHADRYITNSVVHIFLQAYSLRGRKVRFG